MPIDPTTPPRRRPRYLAGLPLLALASGALLAATAGLAGAAERVGPPVPAGGPPVVDVLVLYTPAAERDAGGAQALRRIAERAAAAANQAFVNSRAQVRTRITAVLPAPDYNPGGTAESSAAYGYLFRTPAAASDLRDARRADLTALFASDVGGFSTSVSRPLSPATSGMGDTMMLVGHDRADAEPDLYFTHELGHLLGLSHDRAEDGDVEPFPYARGYLPPSMKWRDIMAYDQPCTAAGRTCPLIPYFSNPRLTYQGEPLGVPIGHPAQADAVSMLDQTAPIVAAYR